MSGNVLKELIISATILTFAPRRPKVEPVLIDRGSAVDIEPIVAPIWPRLTAPEAMRAFFLEMQQHAAGDEVPMRLVRHSYDVMARERDWPATSDKALSQALVDFGCKRRQADLRKSGGGRRSMIEFPLEETPVKRRRRK
jgi:hypothetical protein